MILKTPPPPPGVGQCVVMCLEGGSVGIIQFDSCKIYLTLVASSEVTNPSFKKRWNSNMTADFLWLFIYLLSLLLQSGVLKRKYENKHQHNAAFWFEHSSKLQKEPLHNLQIRNIIIITVKMFKEWMEPACSYEVKQFIQRGKVGGMTAPVLRVCNFSEPVMSLFNHINRKEVFLSQFSNAELIT